MTMKYSRFFGTITVGVRDEVSGKFYVDYKEVDELKRIMTANGKIMSRQRTRLSAMVQRDASIAIKQARYMALLPYHAEQR
jgi:small subunit ribosomal protein S18